MLTQEEYNKISEELQTLLDKYGVEMKISSEIIFVKKDGNKSDKTLPQERQEARQEAD